MAAVNTDQLINDARCIDKCVPDGQKMAVLISVFYQLLVNGPGGVPSGTWAGTGSPQGVVTPAFDGQPYLDKVTNNWWVANGTTNASWVQKA